MPVPITNVIKHHRRDLLGKIEEFAKEYLADLDRRRAGNTVEFHYYVNFCSPMVIDLIAWERIHSVDLQTMPSVKALFVCIARAAHKSVSNHSRRDPEVASGYGRRTFVEIGEAELAANILPRLEHILFCWGISYDSIEDRCTERTLTEDEMNKLTDYYGDF